MDSESKSCGQKTDYELSNEIDSEKVISEEIINAEIQFDIWKSANQSLQRAVETNLDSGLSRVNDELDRFTNHMDKIDYAFAIASGICAGIFDSFFVGEFSFEQAHDWGSEKTEEFILKVAKYQGYNKDDVNKAIKYLAERYHSASDSNIYDLGGPLQHHLRDFSHHASIIGWIFSLLTQFTGKSYGTDTIGRFIIVDVRNREFIGEDFTHKILFGTIYWFFHLVSDVAGSGNINSEGTGIPGPLLSAAKLLAATPLFKNQFNDAGNRELSVFISKLFNGTLLGSHDENGRIKDVLRFDLRTELGIFHQLEKQAIPIVANEILIKVFYFLRRFTNEIAEKNISNISDIKNIEWEQLKPAGNRTIDRMLTISTLTFSLADIADAAVHAAIDSGGESVLFAGHFISKINYVGVGRVAVAIIKEISDERRETQLLREKRILTEAKTAVVLQQLQEYKSALEERVTYYLVEDIEAFLVGFDYMNQGIASNDSDLVIKGNVVIQRILGREPQFSNQQEFDALMDSDDELIL